MSTNERPHVDPDDSPDLPIEIEIEPLAEPPLRQRRHPRYTEPGLSGRMPFCTTANVLDVSRGGVGLQTVEALRAEQNYTLTLLGDQRAWALNGRTVWNRLTATTRTSEGDVQPVYRAGLLFEDGQNPTNQPGLKEFIGRNAVSTRGTGAPTRFQLRDLGPMTLETEYHFDVKTLSLSGMLIETEMTPEPETTVELIMALPATNVEVRGRVVDVLRRPENNRPYAHVGIEFRNLDVADRGEIDRYIEAELR